MTLALLVNGRRYEGWRSVNVTRTIRAAAGSFDLEISDRWSGQEQPWPIVEEDSCRVEVEGQVVIDGWVGSRQQSISASARTFSVSGKDKAGVLVECSTLLTRWSFRNATALDIARTVADQYGITVSLAPGIGSLTPSRKLVVNPGESAWDVIQRAAQTSGLLAISDGAGALRLARAGDSRAQTLVEGRNILAASIDYQAADRFATYVVLAQNAGDDSSSGNALRIRAASRDEDVRRSDRVSVIRPQRRLTRAEARQYADWLARVNAARAESLTVTVQGWTQSSGELWPVNALCAIQAPSIGVDGEMLVAQARYSFSTAGKLTELTLVRPDAFSPDPSAVVRSSGTKWKKERGTE